ncbi:tripartite tricarboxylate transporter TctB family protein [Microbacterium halophytorum]|uniref:tripartite tricarboxylate transporter TctB family protein n=1 Tax=Microbacterium halophytorum TaxID=2067568 RepID=UPI000CFCFDB1|nr:tripartite tricarboxylate transporter TctB family protein [Microbacterium halophytorum]
MSFADHASNNPTAVSATLGRSLTGDPRANGTVEFVKNLVMPALLAAMATYFVVGIVNMDVPEGTMFPGPGFFPGLIAAGLYLFAVLLIGGAVRQKRADAARAGEREAAAALGETPEAEGADDEPARMRWGSLAWVVLGFLGFALTLGFLGWIIGAALLFWCVARGFGEKRHVLSLVVGLTASSIAYIAFDMALGLSLPSGILGGVL